jgi:hypothetical protein
MKRFLITGDDSDRIEVVVFSDHCRISVFPLGHDMALDGGMSLADAVKLGQFLIKECMETDGGC